MAVDGAMEARLEEIAEHHHLGADQRSQLGALLLRLNSHEHAPTSVREPLSAIDVHLADSLVALDLDLDQTITKVADIGSGAGFPGLPLAIARPSWDVSLLESQSRKCSFIEGIARDVGVQNATTVCSRAEEWIAGLAAQDLVLARAVSSQAVVLEYAAPFLRLGGMLIDWRGRRAALEEKNAEAAAGILGLSRRGGTSRDAV